MDCSSLMFVFLLTTQDAHQYVTDKLSLVFLLTFPSTILFLFLKKRKHI
jgi:hypothetical protein